MSNLSIPTFAKFADVRVSCLAKGRVRECSGYEPNNLWGAGHCEYYVGGNCNLLSAKLYEIINRKGVEWLLQTC